MGVVGEVRVRELSAFPAMAGKKPTRGIASFFPVLGRKRPYSDPDKPEDASAEEGIQASSSASARKVPAPTGENFATVELKFKQRGFHSSTSTSIMHLHIHAHVW